MSTNRSVAVLNQADATKTKALLVELIGDAVDFLNIGKTMNASQIMQTIDMILESDYSVYKPDDFKLCFSRAKRGQYGVVYDRIDGQVIFQWLDKYILERNSEIEDLRLSQKKNQQKSLDSIKPDEAVPMPEFMKDLLKKQQVDKLVSKPRVLVQTEQQKKISEAMAEFDRLYKNQIKDNDDFGKRHVIVDLKLTSEQKYKEIEFIKKDVMTIRDLNERKKRESSRIAQVGYKSMDISEYISYAIAKD